MVLSCLTISYHAAAHAVGPPLRAVRNGFAHIRRHTVHRTWRAAHAVLNNPGSWLDSACRVAPGAFAAGLLALSPPANDLRAAVFQPPGMSVQVAPDSMTYDLPAATLPRLDLTAPGLEADLGPAPSTARLDDISSGPLPSIMLAGVVAPWADLDLHSSKRLDRAPLLATTATSVPEPSSLVVLASALCALNLLVHRRD